MLCSSNCNLPGSIILHSCCRGGLNQVAWSMIQCCSDVHYVCGPRNNISPLDLLICFNLFLYNVEVRMMDPVVAADKVLSAVDIRLVCYDRLDVETEPGYVNHCEIKSGEVDSAFESIDGYDFTTTIA